MKAKLFINYRRDDTRHAAGRLYDQLTVHFGKDQVFMDIDQIAFGDDFVEVINRKVGTCDIAIVMIGRQWLGADDASGKRRLDDEEDFVRMEIVAALQRKIRVIPVLVDGAQMPRRHDLPEALAPLSRRNAFELSDTRFHADVNCLIEAIKRSLAVAENKTELSATPAAPPPETAIVRPPEPEFKDIPEPSEFMKAVEPKQPKEIEASVTPGVVPVSLVATAKDSTTPVKSTQVTPATPAVPSSFSIATSTEPRVWTSQRLIIISAIVLFLLAIAGSFMWPVHRKASKQGNQPSIANPERLSNPAEPQSADQGNAVAQVNDGWKYEYGVGVPKDLEKARELYQKAADQGNAFAQNSLGWLYENGEGVPKDLGKAAELYQKAADQGYADAQYNLGVLYENGWGVPKDVGKATGLYQKAANQGYKPAITQLNALPAHPND